jgi:protein pelota
MAMAGRGGKRFAMGYVEAAAALEAGAVDRMVYSEGLFQNNAEEDIVELLNRAEASGVTMYGVDSTTDTGLRVTNLGGVVAVLRYALS